MSGEHSPLSDLELSGIRNITGQAFFVYTGSGKHLWRFVWHGQATSGRDAIEQAQAEARALGNEPGRSYLAVPAWACTTTDHGD